jgi:signal transduction histidine kinase
MADASHELRTPVATTRTAAAVALQQPHRSEEEYRETLEIIDQQTGRLARVVEDMFTLARADAGNYPVQRAPLYLEELVEDVARGARVLAERKAVSIEQIAPEDAPFTGDEDLLRRMVGNLMDNAMKHAPAGSTVRIELIRQADTYRISVTDNGLGIPEEARPHIFERFYRGDAARGRSAAEPGGAGLGLAIAQWVAKQHGGDVTLIQSTGRATTFQITLPYRAQP